MKLPKKNKTSKKFELFFETKKNKPQKQIIEPSKKSIKNQTCEKNINFSGKNNQTSEINNKIFEKIARTLETKNQPFEKYVIFSKKSY